MLQKKIDILSFFSQWGRLEFEYYSRGGALIRAILLAPPSPAPTPSADRRRVGEREAGVLRGRFFSPRQPSLGRGRRWRTEDDPSAAAALQWRRRRRHHEAFVLHASDATGMHLIPNAP